MLELKKGTQLADRYTLVRRLGGDGDTSTWLAKDRLTKASVALKIADAGPESQERLRAEWQKSIRLMHAHIVRAFEFHAEPDVTIFCQQFIDGPTMGALTGLPVAKVLGPIGYVANALAYLHDKSIVHRDIKASNILLDSNGAPYLADFSVSAGAGKPASGGSTIAASPQSLAGAPATASDDIFALGSLLFELLSGQPPWPAANMADAIESGTVPPLMAADGSMLPREVTSLVLEMLDVDATRRPTAAEVGDRLTAAGFPPALATVRGLPTTAPVVDSDESVQRIRPVQRSVEEQVKPAELESGGLNPRTVGLALLALVLVLVAVIFVLPDNVRVDDPGDNVAPVVVSEPDVRPPVVVDSADSETRKRVYVDPEIRKRIKGDATAPTRTLAGDSEITFSENQGDYSGLDEEGRARFDAELTLGEFLSAMEVLEGRGVEKWAPREHSSASDLYIEADKAYLEKDFAYAEELYLGALTILEPLYERIEPTFQEAMRLGQIAFDEGDRLEAISQFELAVAVTPSHPDAQFKYQRARNLETVLRLVEQGMDFEEDLDLDAAQRSFEQAVKLDSLWQPAQDGVLRVEETRTKIEFDTRMSEGFEAIAMQDFLAARAAFRVAQQLLPNSTEPADGLLQVDQGLRLQEISTLEREAKALEQDEHWEAVVQTYEEILKVDGTLVFASEGLQRGRQMSALHKQLDDYIAEPDRLSHPSVMQEATTLLVGITTRREVGSRLAGQRDELSRLLKRAATPLTIPLVSDNVTEVFVYKVGRLGNFMRKEIDLRPGTYVVVGSRPGYRDVRLEFRVAPEVATEPVVVQCEEPI